MFPSTRTPLSHYFVHSFLQLRAVSRPPLRFSSDVSYRPQASVRRSERHTTGALRLPCGGDLRVQRADRPDMSPEPVCGARKRAAKTAARPETHPERTEKRFCPLTKKPPTIAGRGLFVTFSRTGAQRCAPTVLMPWPMFDLQHLFLSFNTFPPGWACPKARRLSFPGCP
jgi:hypothetical protein